MVRCAAATASTGVWRGGGYLLATRTHSARKSGNRLPALCDAFLDRLDGPFKQQLDRYKYASRFDPSIGQQSRQDACVFLAEINQFLESGAGYLSGAAFGVLDAATLPFVRQFRGVDEIWFDSQPWPHLHRWLGMFLNSADFGVVMEKYLPWQADDSMILFPA